MKVGDKVYAVFHEYDILLVTIRNIGTEGKGAYVLKEGQNPNEARYFQNKWLFNTKLAAIRNCQERLAKKIKKSVEFYNMLNDQVADAVTEDVMAGWIEKHGLNEEEVLDRGYF